MFISGNKHMCYCSLADENRTGKEEREGIERDIAIIIYLITTNFVIEHLGMVPWEEAYCICLVIRYELPVEATGNENEVYM